LNLDAWNASCVDSTLQSRFCGTTPFKPAPVIKIVIVEDQPLTLVGIRMSLGEVDGFQVIGEATTGVDAVSETLRLEPDVVLMDVSLPDMSGLEAATALKKLLPNTRVIMFTSHHGAETVIAAVKAGAEGFLSKDRSLEEITSAIITVSQGNYWIDPVIADSIIRNSVDTSLSFTKWETQVLTLLRDGVNIKAVANQLRTTEDAVTAVMRGMFKAISTLSDEGGVEPLLHTKAPPEIGNLFEGKYAIQATIGRGGAGCVYKANHIFMGREVAIKMLHNSLLDDRDALRGFRQEAMTVACLDHPNVIRIHDFGVSNAGDPYLVMEYFEGETLRELLRKHKSLSPAQFFDVFVPICDALAAAHSAGIVHCDLKPGNILIKHHGSSTVLPKLVDFGLAKFAEASRSPSNVQPGEVIIEGTPAYMSPEQCSGQPVVIASDIYGLGCVMFESLTGMTVFGGSNPVEVFANQINAQPPLLSEVLPNAQFPPDLEHLIFLMLQKDPARRPQRVDEILQVMLRLRTHYSERNHAQV